MSGLPRRSPRCSTEHPALVGRRALPAHVGDQRLPHHARQRQHGPSTVLSGAYLQGAAAPVDVVQTQVGHLAGPQPQGRQALHDCQVPLPARGLLLHLGCGHSLRETVVRARQAHLADLSDVALLKRLKKSKGWLHALCVRLFEEQGLAVIPGGAFQVRAVDATTVKEPGPSGSLWRLHYSVGLPSLACDFFKLTGTEGPGTGESLAQFPIRAGDHVLADRGYSTARGIRHVVDAGGRLIVRVNTGSLPLCTTAGRPFDLLAAVGSVTRPGAVRSWAITVAVPGDDGGPAGKIAGRVCVLRKSAEAIRLAHQKVRRDAARKGNQVQPATLRFAEYVIVFTTFPEPPFSAADVLEWYRLRWQVELVFKRFKSLAQLGHVPK